MNRTSAGCAAGPGCGVGPCGGVAWEAGWAVEAVALIQSYGNDDQQWHGLLLKQAARPGAAKLLSPRGQPAATVRSYCSSESPRESGQWASVPAPRTRSSPPPPLCPHTS